MAEDPRRTPHREVPRDASGRVLPGAWISADDAGRQLGVSGRTIRRMCHRGEVVGQNYAGRGWSVLESSLPPSIR
jgi:hypothetical protein